MKNKKRLQENIQKKYDHVDRRRPKNKKTKDIVKGQSSLGLFAGDAISKSTSHDL